MKKSFLNWFTEQLPIKYMMGIIKDAHYWQKHSLVDCLKTKPTEKKYFSHLKKISLIISILLTVLLSAGPNKDFAGYAIASLSILIGLNINLIIMMFDKFNYIDFKTDNKTIYEKTSLVKKREFFKQFTSLTAYSILLSIFLIVLLSLCFLNKYTEPINIIEKIKYILDVKITHLEFSFNILIKSILETFILLSRAITYYLLFYYIIILFYNIGSAYAFISKEYKSKKIKVYDNQSI